MSKQKTSSNINYNYFTSESVCAGHPDKICDAISDAIVDEVLRQDPRVKVAVEAAVKDRVVLIGEINTTADINYEEIVRKTIKNLGYVNEDWGFWVNSPIEVHVNKQSPEIAQGVDDDEGAGDQGMMFGYACNETKELMPLPITLAHWIARRLDETRELGELSYLRPDGKAQVTVEYKDGQPVAVNKIVVATPHDEAVRLDQVRKDVINQIINPLLDIYGYSIDDADIIINGTGTWHMPGPESDAGLTGRKIIVDGYGGMARVGGGAFSGKDPSKVDRSAAYASRYLAKNIVAAGLADRAEVALAYCIGVAEPVMQAVETFGTQTVSDKELDAFVRKTLDTSVKGIVEGLNLRQPIYSQTAAYGHFGKPGLPWENVIN